MKINTFAIEKLLEGKQKLTTKEICVLLGIQPNKENKLMIRSLMQHSNKIKVTYKYSTTGYLITLYSLEI